LPPVTIPTPAEAVNKTHLSRPVRVAAAIKQWLVEQQLVPGDRLPNEAELIQRFGMAKSTIREAMRILEAQGLIKTRTGPGGGSFVHEVSKERASALLGNYFYFKNLTVADIYQLRQILEPELAASLAGKLSEDVLQELQANIAATYIEPPQSLDEEREYHLASLRFHALLAEHAQNALLGFLIDFIANILSELTVVRKLYSLPNSELWARGREYQERLLEALRQGDADAARGIMAEHMKTAQILMQGQEAEIIRQFMRE